MKYPELEAYIFMVPDLNILGLDPEVSGVLSLLFMMDKLSESNKSWDKKTNETEIIYERKNRKA